ncbi:MAG: DUF58 domain-containing protein [Halobacteriales archaeon]|nr:DUF58 domain-containing protein [Halobacteriales archaeon]
MIDPDFLYELERFESELKRKVNSVFQGEQETSHTGEGLIFADHRNYVPGDDTRLIDWNLYARTEEHYIKRYEEERNLTTHILLDASGSMDYGEGEANKFDYAAKIGLGYAYLTAAENNDFRFSVFTDTFERIDSGKSNPGEVLSLIDTLNETEPEGRAEFGRALGEYASTIGSRSLVVVVSDFVGELDGIEDGIDALADSYLRLVCTLSHDELELPVSGDTIFEGIETESRLRTFISNRTRGRYQERLEEHLEEVEEHAESLGAGYVLVDTDDNFFDSFARAWPE